LFAIFRIPLISFSAVNGFIAIGMQGYMSQQNISLVNALMSLFCGILTSVEMLLNLQKRMESELESYKNYYKLSIEIYKQLKTCENGTDNRAKMEYLEQVYEEYTKYLDVGNAVNRYERAIMDELELHDIYNETVKETVKREEINHSVEIDVIPRHSVKIQQNNEYSHWICCPNRCERCFFL